MSLAEKGGGGGQKTWMIQIWSVLLCPPLYDDQTMPLIGFAALLKRDDRHKIFTRRLSPSVTGWKDVFGGTQSLLQNRAAHTSGTSFKINAYKQCNEKWWRMFWCGAHRGKKGGGWTIGNAFFSFWQWQVQQSRQSTVSVPWGRGVGKFQWPALFGPALPQGNFCGELFSHSLHFITLGIFTESDHNNIKT